MGAVIDLAIFKKSRDIQQSTLSTPEEDRPPKALPLTLRLNLLAQKATRIIYYRPDTPSWKTVSAHIICIAIKEDFYTLTQPFPNMIRLLVYDSALTHIDFYFSKKFYNSPEAIPMLTALVDEVLTRGCCVMNNFLSSINYVKAEQRKPRESHIDWESLHQNPFGDNPSPSIS